MRSEELDVQSALMLLSEVAGVLRAPSLLSGEDARTSHVIPFGDGREYGWSVVDVSQYVWSIDVDRDESPYLDLNGILDDVRQSYQFFRSYAPVHEVGRALNEHFESVHDILQHSAGAQRLADQAFEADNRREPRDEYYDHILNTVSQHFHAIAYARLTTLSRRFPVTECILDAYAAGLFPFGWSDESERVLCVRP